MTTTESELSYVPEPVIDEATLERLMAKIEAEGLELLGPDGVLTELTSRLMNRAMQTELTDHLGYEAGDPAGRGSGNNRNGSSPKRVLTARQTDGTSVAMAAQRRVGGGQSPGQRDVAERRLPSLIGGLVDVEAQPAVRPAGVVGDELVDNQAPARQLGQSASDAEVEAADGVGVDEGGRRERAGSQDDLDSITSRAHHRVEAVAFHRLGHRFDRIVHPSGAET